MLLIFRWRSSCLNLFDSTEQICILISLVTITLLIYLFTWLNQAPSYKYLLSWWQFAKNFSLLLNYSNSEKSLGIFLTISQSLIIRIYNMKLLLKGKKDFRPWMKISRIWHSSCWWSQKGTLKIMRFCDKCMRSQGKYFEGDQSTITLGWLVFHSTAGSFWRAHEMEFWYNLFTTVKNHTGYLFIYLIYTF